MVSGFYFLSDSLPFFVRLRAAAPLWGGSDVVPCVWVSLTGTTVALSWAHWSLVGGLVCTLPLLCDIIHGNGALLNAL